MKPSVVILAFNSAETLPATIKRALLISDDVVVVDSYSSDNSVEIARLLGATVYQHCFENYGSQRNWAIDSLPLRYSWQLHLDADEWMDDVLVQSIRDLPEATAHAGFLVPRYLKFLGRVLKHGAMSPTWHLRLFQTGIGRCEDRKYDQHFYLLSGTTARLPGHMIDDVRMSLSEWTARHNRWADSEVDELTCSKSHESIQKKVLGNAIEQKRYWRSKYDDLPLFVRPIALFIYRYFIRLGCLDGKEGLIFWVLQTFWFRFLVDSKLFEKRMSESSHA